MWAAAIVALLSAAGIAFLSWAVAIFATTPDAALFTFAAGIACLTPAAYLAARIPGVAVSGSASGALALAAVIMQSAAH
jgi:hypothetical protein